MQRTDARRELQVFVEGERLPGFEATAAQRQVARRYFVRDSVLEEKPHRLGLGYSHDPFGAGVHIGEQEAAVRGDIVEGETVGDVTEDFPVFLLLFAQVAIE